MKLQTIPITRETHILIRCHGTSGKPCDHVYDCRLHEVETSMKRCEKCDAKYGDVAINGIIDLVNQLGAAQPFTVEIVVPESTP